MLYLHSMHTTENRAGSPKPYCTSTKQHCATSKQTIIYMIFILHILKALKLFCPISVLLWRPVMMSITDKVGILTKNSGS